MQFSHYRFHNTPTTVKLILVQYFDFVQIYTAFNGLITPIIKFYKLVFQFSAQGHILRRAAVISWRIGNYTTRFSSGHS
jgi:hypothetical protein